MKITRGHFNYSVTSRSISLVSPDLIC